MNLYSYIEYNEIAISDTHKIYPTLKSVRTSYKTFPKNVSCLLSTNITTKHKSSFSTKHD